MTTLTALKRGVVTMVAVLAAATAFGRTAEPASAGVQFSDGSAAYVSLGCFADFVGSRFIQGSAFNAAINGPPTEYQIWIWDQARGWQAVWGTWVPVNPRRNTLVTVNFVGPRMNRWVAAYYRRWINGRYEMFSEWVILRIGPYVEAPYCYL